MAFGAAPVEGMLANGAGVMHGLLIGGGELQTLLHAARE